MSDSSDDDSYGPALPPHLQIQKPIGPQLPTSFLQRKPTGDQEQDTAPLSATVTVEEPALEPELDNAEEDDSDDDYGIGPYPPDDPRSLRVAPIRPQGPEQDTRLKREEWMLIPPKNKTITEVVGLQGVTARKFLGRTPDEVRAPEGEEEEVDFLEEARTQFAEKTGHERDSRMDAMLEGAVGSKSKESLLHLHRKRRKVDDSDEQSKERRPFDRDVDLKVGGLSAEEKEKFIKKTTELTGRFSRGKQKFL